MTNSTFQNWLDRFFASYFRHRPVNASFIGAHAHDHALPDYSEQGVADVLNDMDSLLRETQHVDEAALDPIERIDLRLAQGFLRIQLWEYRSNHFRAGNPSLYTGEAIFSIVGLFLTNYAPARKRVAAAVERMHLIEQLLLQGQRNVRSAPLAWTQRALRECSGARALFEHGVDLLAAELDVTTPDFRRAANAALAAFERFEAYLANELHTAETSDYACGEETFDLLMRQGHFLDMSPDDIATYAAEKLTQAEEYLATHASEFGETHWKDALARLADSHPSTDTYLGRYRELWDASYRLVAEQGLLTWPEFPIEYVPQPSWAREAAPYLYFLFYRAPAAYNRPAVHRYLVTPIDASIPEQEQMRRLRATNESTIKLNHVVHHGGVGHHVQNWYAYHSRSRIGQIAAVDCASRIAMFCGGTMAEGWACYATNLMNEAGFLTPLESFAEAHSDLRMAARAVVDVRLHQGRMTLGDAARFYTERTAMSIEASYAEAVKNSMFPGAAMMYLMGRATILDLRSDLKQRQGAVFSAKAFHNRFLSFGSIPVSLIATAMRQEAADDNE